MSQLFGVVQCCAVLCSVVQCCAVQKIRKSTGMLRLGFEMLISPTGMRRVGPASDAGKWDMGEQVTMLRLHSLYGNKWHRISQEMPEPRRSEDEIKNAMSVCCMHAYGTAF